MIERIREIVIKEFRQTLREKRTRILLIMPPLFQLLIFGFAVNMDVESARIAWSDMDRTPESRDLLARFAGSGRFEILATPQNETEVQQLLDKGEVQAVVRVLPGFARDLNRGDQGAVQILVDGTNSNTASIVSGYATSVVLGMTRTARTRVWFNPDLHSRNYFVPGVIVNIIMMVTLMLTAMGIVREKEIGTMEQLMVTPIRPIELMIGKTLPYAMIGIVQVLFITTAALLIFRVPFRGNPLLLIFCAVLFLMTSLGAGLFLSTISATQQQAMMASFFFVTPAFMLSGFTFPIRNMPTIVQYLTYLDPLRYFMEIVRGIFLKGTGVAVLWPQMAALAIYGVAVLGLSALRFKKRLD